jgi:glutaredoxin
MPFNRITIPVLFVVAITATPVSMAQAYRDIDKNGKVAYTDKKPERIASVEKIRVREKTVSSQETYSGGEASRDVAIYTAEWCKYCKTAKAYMDERGIAYVEYDIEKDRYAKREYRKLGGNGLPLILVGDQRMSGFSQKGFDKLYSSER